MPLCNTMHHTSLSSKSNLASIPSFPRPSPFCSTPTTRRHTHRHRHQTTTTPRAVLVEAKPQQQSLLPSLISPRPQQQQQQLQNTIIECLSNITGKGKGGMTSETQAIFDKAVAALERDGGIRNPADSSLLQGRWKLLFTSRPTTASPIQNSFTGIDAFTVYQEILVNDPSSSVRVNNIVDFGRKFGYLKVEAEGSTPQRPIPNFTPRQGSGLPFGILGVSSSTPPAYPGLRVDFQFDKAAFYFKLLPFTLPYPVPFKLLGDERKGWLDVTYLSADGKFRLSRGNKGTLFVLVKDETLDQQLINTITQNNNTNTSKKRGSSDGNSNDDGIEALIDRLLQEQGTGITSPAQSKQATGSWRLIWTKQGETANPLQKKLTGVVKNWQIISSDGTKLENRVELLPGVRVRALAEAQAQSTTRTRVVITDVILQVGPFKFDIPITRDADGYVDWLYLNDGLRITKGNKGSTFVHVRDTSVAEEWE